MRAFTLAHKLMRLTEAHCKEVPMSLIRKFEMAIEAHHEENKRLAQAKKEREEHEQNRKKNKTQLAG